MFITFFWLGTQIRALSHIFCIFLVVFFSYYFHIFVKTSFSSISIRTIFTKLEVKPGPQRPRAQGPARGQALRYMYVHI